MFKFWFSKRDQQPTYIPPKTLSDKPWKTNVHWTTEYEQSLKREIRELRPDENLNLLMSGQVGVGKSSFICSVLSIGKGRRVGMSITGDAAHASLTLELIRYGKGTLLEGFRLYDCMGLEQGNGQGLHEEDFMFLLDGHIKNGYMFNPVSPITEGSSKYRPGNNVLHQMHCVIFVASATSVHAGFSSEYVQKIQQLQKKIKRKRIPRILILTKVEQLCDEVEKDITKMFRSLKIKETVETASEIYAIEKASIHPVVNYEAICDVNVATNIPILLALRQAKQYAIDRFEFLSEVESDGSQ